MDKDKAEKKQGVDVAYVAHLARLHLTDSEIQRFQGQLDQILNYVKELEALDVSQVEPTAHAIPVYNVFRTDATRPCLDREEVLRNAPLHNRDQFIVPKIVE